MHMSVSKTEFIAAVTTSLRRVGRSSFSCNRWSIYLASIKYCSEIYVHVKLGLHDIASLS